MNCKYCNHPCIKKGYAGAIQRFYCKHCKRYQQQNYRYRLCNQQDENMIIKLNNEGLGISSISRLTGISKANVINLIRHIASKIEQPVFRETDQEYEADELQTYIRKKEKNNRPFQ
jgi:transposase-like protein